MYLLNVNYEIKKGISFNFYILNFSIFFSIFWFFSIFSFLYFEHSIFLFSIFFYISFFYILIPHRNKRRNSLYRKWPFNFTCQTENFWIFWYIIVFSFTVKLSKRKKALFQSIWQSNYSEIFSFTCIIKRSFTAVL